MVKRKIVRVGGKSMAAVIPPVIAQLLGLGPGDLVEIDIVKNGDTAIIIRPVKGEEQNGH